MASTKRKKVPPRAAAQPAKSAAAPAKSPGRRVFATLAELPTVPMWKMGRDGKPLVQRVQVRDAEGKVKWVEEKVAFDPNEELKHRNRFGQMLLYRFKLNKRDKAEKRVPITVNDHRFTVLRGEWVIVPWYVVHSSRDRWERKFSQEPDPDRPGRKITVAEDQLAESFEARPIDPCDDFDDETAHLAVKPDEDTHDAQDLGLIPPGVHDLGGEEALQPIT